MFNPDKNLVIMAGGSSSRMKHSLADSNLNKDLIQKALKVHKALITLGKKKVATPLLPITKRIASRLPKHIPNCRRNRYAF